MNFTKQPKLKTPLQYNEVLNLLLLKYISIIIIQINIKLREYILQKKLTEVGNRYITFKE